MRAANGWQDYQILDTSGGDKLERWGNTFLIRPDPQIIWNTPKENPYWKKANAAYFRSSSGGGHWEFYSMPKPEWTVGYKHLTFLVRPTNFKHMGLFPEQAVNWDWMADKIIQAGRPVSVLNLFAYTGGATLACAAAGANVCHVDASKGMTAWARENAKRSGLDSKPIRWIVDDCRKFVEREIRRGNRYDAVIMDPPSYGRGPGGEVWKLEDQIFDLVNLCAGVLKEKPLFFLLNSYTTGLPPAVMEYLLGVTVGKQFQGAVSSGEIGLTVQDSGKILPCGSTAIWEDSSAG